MICWTQSSDKKIYYQIICFNVSNKNQHFSNITADMDEKLYQEIACSVKPRISHPEMTVINLFELDKNRDSILKEVEINEKCPYYVEHLIIGA